jgi:hypothetical protein
LNRWKLTNSPGEHDEAEPEGRAGTLHHEIARNFSGDIKRKEYSECNLRGEDEKCRERKTGYIHCNRD